MLIIVLLPVLGVKLVEDAMSHYADDAVALNGNTVEGRNAELKNGNWNLTLTLTKP